MNSQPVRYETPNLMIQRLTDHTFIHVSYIETTDWGRVKCNGLIVTDGNATIVIEAPATKAASNELIHWVDKELESKITSIVVSHSHSDALGDLTEFHKIGAQSFANNLTIELAQKDSIPILPINGFDNRLELMANNTKVINEFFGPGHTKDNIVSYIPDQNVLFGGCLIKAMNASKGNLEDADTLAWSATVQRILTNYPEIKHVVPGHGAAGSRALLTYTIQLFETASSE